MLTLAVNFLQKQQKQQDPLCQTAGRLMQSRGRLRKPGNMLDFDE
jgi:hypothetical protein